MESYPAHCSIVNYYICSRNIKFLFKLILHFQWCKNQIIHKRKYYIIVLFTSSASKQCMYTIHVNYIPLYNKGLNKIRVPSSEYGSAVHISPTLSNINFVTTAKLNHLPSSLKMVNKTPTIDKQNQLLYFLRLSSCKNRSNLFLFSHIEFYHALELKIGNSRYKIDTKSILNGCKSWK